MDTMTMKRNLPDTSLEAWHEKNKTLQSDYDRIQTVLAKWYTRQDGMNYEEIAMKIGMEPVAVARRLSEMVREYKIERLLVRSKTNKGRYAYNYRLKTKF